MRFYLTKPRSVKPLLLVPVTHDLPREHKSSRNRLRATVRMLSLSRDSRFLDSSGDVERVIPCDETKRRL
jgi:hypothetical protein